MDYIQECDHYYCPDKILISKVEIKKTKMPFENINGKDSHNVKHPDIEVLKNSGEKEGAMKGETEADYKDIYVRSELTHGEFVKILAR